MPWHWPILSFRKALMFTFTVIRGTVNRPAGRVSSPSPPAQMDPAFYKATGFCFTAQKDDCNTGLRRDSWLRQYFGHECLSEPRRSASCKQYSQAPGGFESFTAFLKKSALLSSPKYHVRSWIESAPFRMKQRPVIIAISEMVRQDMANYCLHQL